jgi:hypothetical protein
VYITSDAEDHIQPDKIGQREQPHQVIHAEFHHGINRFGGADASINAMASLIIAQDAVGDKAGKIRR